MQKFRQRNYFLIIKKIDDNFLFTYFNSHDTIENSVRKSRIILVYYVIVL